MPRSVAAAVHRALIDAFPPDRAYPRAAYARPPMPPAVAHFLDYALDRRLDLELAALREARSPWFDYARPEVERAHRQLGEALAAHAQIPKDEWPAILEKAVEEVAAFLVRPARTLAGFLFREETTLPVDEVRRRLGYFEPYPYFAEIVDGYFAQKQVDRIDRDRFTALLHRIDRQMVEDYGPKDWLRLLDPLFDFVQVAGEDDAPTIPIALLRAFFADKEKPDLERRLAFEQERRRVDALDPEGLHRLLEAPPEWFAEPDRTPPPRPAPQAPPSAPRSAPPPAGQDPELVPLWRRFQERMTTPPDAPPPESPAPKPAPRRPEATERRETAERPEAGGRREAAERRETAERREGLPLWRQFRTEDDPPPKGDADDAEPSLETLERDVLGARGTRNRALFVKHLFDGSADDYARVLQRLQAAPSWPEASKIIARDIFREHQVNIYSEPAVAFTDAVEARYR